VIDQRQRESLPDRPAAALSHRGARAALRQWSRRQQRERRGTRSPSLVERVRRRRWTEFFAPPGLARTQPERGAQLPRPRELSGRLERTAPVARALPDVRWRGRPHADRDERRVERRQRTLGGLGAVVDRSVVLRGQAGRDLDLVRQRLVGAGSRPFVDDTTVSTGETTSSEDGLGGWTVSGPPVGSAPNSNDWTRTPLPASPRARRSRRRGPSTSVSGSRASQRPPRATPSSAARSAICCADTGRGEGGPARPSPLLPPGTTSRRAQHQKPVSVVKRSTCTYVVPRSRNVPSAVTIRA
jgi:hypothetical protein